METAAPAIMRLAMGTAVCLPPRPARGATVGVPVRALYAIPEAMVLLSLSRTQIYELIRSDRLLTVTQGRRRLVPAEAITAYVALLLSEAGSGRDRAA